MSFDSFFDEAGQLNEAIDPDEDDIPESQLTHELYKAVEKEVEPLEIEDEDEGDFWDDDYDWTKRALHHDDYHMGGQEVPKLKDLLKEDNEQPSAYHQPHHFELVQPYVASGQSVSAKEAERAVQAYLQQVQEQAMHDLVPIIAHAKDEQSLEMRDEIPELDFDDSEDDMRNDLHATDEKPAAIFDDEEQFSEQDYMDYVIKLVI